MIRGFSTQYFLNHLIEAESLVLFSECVIGLQSRENVICGDFKTVENLTRIKPGRQPTEISLKLFNRIGSSQKVLDVEDVIDQVVER